MVNTPLEKLVLEQGVGGEAEEKGGGKWKRRDTTAFMQLGEFRRGSFAGDWARRSTGDWRKKGSAGDVEKKGKWSPLRKGEKEDEGAEVEVEVEVEAEEEEVEDEGQWTKLLPGDKEFFSKFLKFFLVVGFLFFSNCVALFFFTCPFLTSFPIAHLANRAKKPSTFEEEAFQSLLINYVCACGFVG